MGSGIEVNEIKTHRPMRTQLYKLMQNSDINNRMRQRLTDSSIIIGQYIIKFLARRKTAKFTDQNSAFNCKVDSAFRFIRHTFPKSFKRTLIAIVF